MTIDVPDTSLHENTLARLRDYIVHGHIAGGERVPERELCAMLNVSRTPLREALKVLAAEGLVELVPNRGAWVPRFDEQDIRSLFEVVGGLETLASRLACDRMTGEELAAIRNLHMQMYTHYLQRDLPEYFRLNQAIHTAIVDAARNAVLKASYTTLNARLRRVRYSANQLRGDRWSRAMREHENVLLALGNRDGPALAEIMHQHMREKCEAACEHLRMLEGTEP